MTLELKLNDEVEYVFRGKVTSMTGRYFQLDGGPQFLMQPGYYDCQAEMRIIKAAVKWQDGDVAYRPDTRLVRFRHNGTWWSGPNGTGISHGTDDMADHIGYLPIIQMGVRV